MEQIKLKQVGQNLIAIIDGKQYSKMFANKEERDSVKNKVLLYNKKPTKALQTAILKLIDKTIIEKETKIAKTKGVKKAIKKEVKKSAKKSPKKENDDLVKTVETEFKAGNFGEEQIKRLEDLLRKKRATLEPKAVIKQEDSNNDGSRERYR